MALRRVLVLYLVAGVAACAVAAARADTVPIPDDGAMPWDSGSATSPLEGLAGRIASTIAGRTVTVRCEGGDWLELTASAHVPPNTLGFVPWQSGGPLGYAELSAAVCGPLQVFALATTKPTKCTTATTEQRATTAVRRIRRRVRRGSRTKLVWVTRSVPVVETVHVKSAPHPCYASGQPAPPAVGDPFWDNYTLFATAIETLAHESIHLRGDPVEADAECYGIQQTAFVAEQLGDTPDDAQAIATFYFEQLYPKRRAAYPQYWSPECRPGGALDATPGDGVWP